MKNNQPFSLNMDFEEALTRYASINFDKSKKDLQQKAKPFVKWVGGKRGLLEDLLSHIPEQFNNYYEPFVGGGALFYGIKDKAKQCYLSDMNLELIISYHVIQKDLDKLIISLEQHKQNHSKDYYMTIRSQHNIENPIELASRFIYLNKTCFNGLYRVNQKDEFNVPIGAYKNPKILDIENLTLCNQVLQNVNIRYHSFEKIDARKGDFVYFDPPYHPLNTTSSFTSYTKLDFTEDDQKKLRDFALSLLKKGVFVMLSNSDCEFIREIYKSDKFKINSIQAKRSINCKGNKRNSISELLITTY